MAIFIDHTSPVSRLRELTRKPAPVTAAILLGDPAAFDVRWAINAHMLTESGALQTVNRERARAQWSSLRSAYERLGFRVLVLPSTADLCDQVFVANPAFPFSDPQDGASSVLLSNMCHQERQQEPELLGEFLRGVGVRVVRAETSETFEGTGDLIQFPGQRLICGGLGPRSVRAGLEEAARIAAADLVLLRLSDPRYYHLDTCLALLDARTALWVPEAFPEEERRILAALIPRLLAVPGTEGVDAFAGNAHSPDGRHVLLDAAAADTSALLAREGFVPVPVDTSEFRKSGGSVFCLKLALTAAM